MSGGLRDAGPTPESAAPGFLPCGCCVAAVSGRLSRRELAREIATFVRQGYRVEPRSIEWVRGNLQECIHKARQEELALEVIPVSRGPSPVGQEKP